METLRSRWGSGYPFSKVNWIAHLYMAILAPLEYSEGNDLEHKIKIRSCSGKRAGRPVALRDQSILGAAPRASRAAVIDKPLLVQAMWVSVNGISVVWLCGRFLCIVHQLLFKASEDHKGV